MESKNFGADGDELKRRAAEKKAKFDAIRQRIIETNAKPFDRGKFLKKALEIAERNRKRDDEWRRDQQSDQAPNHAA